MVQLSVIRRPMEDMTVRNMSQATQRSYSARLRSSAGLLGRSPERLDL